MGIKKTFEKIAQARVIIFLLDAEKFQISDKIFQQEIVRTKKKYPDKPFILVVNKIDKMDKAGENKLTASFGDLAGISTLLLSAKTGEGVEELKGNLLNFVNTGSLRNNETIVTNSRHYNALLKALEEINKVQQAIADGISGDLIAIDVRQALYHFGEITGEISSDELLGNIFANFCIGK